MTMLDGQLADHPGSPDHPAWHYNSHGLPWTKENHMTNKKETPPEKTSVPQQEKLTENDLVNVATELSDEDMKDVSGGLGEAIFGEAA